MSDILGAVALQQAQFQQQLGIALLKQDFAQQEQILQIVDDAGAAAQSGSQSLNSSGTGQIVNILA
ncbi:hypothetical protein HH303_13695 [Rhodospirillaceae bacterium KN72]|uniref:Motility protein n=1 Tax=Pacificispira spongiicola TaxID=2729598 RepID=A0A7Y0E1Q6_9PROT|nr:hypothetical protein [Pacificispira spongiicola]NMM45543.1 hypothetical protein [Pacificispira spongiicola]